MTTSITLRNVWTIVQSDDDEVIRVVKKIASYRQQGWERARDAWLKKLARQGRANRHDWEYKRAVEWQGWRFIGEECGSGCLQIPSGCVVMAIQAISMLDDDVTVFNERERPKQLTDVDWSLTKNKTPRDYQTDAVTSLLKRGGTGIIQSPTASGKSYMMALLISKLKVTTLIKVPRLVILDQIVDELKDALVVEEGQIGTIGRGKYEPSLITVTTTQSLYNILKDKKRWREFNNLHRGHGWGMIIEDEVHRGAAKTSYETSLAIDSYYRVGFSATPLDREDGENIKTIGAFGEIVVDIPAEPLIENDWLIRPMIKFVPVRAIPMDRNAQWPDVYNTAIVYNNERNKKVLDIASDMTKQDRSTLIFVDRIDHGEQLENMAPNWPELDGVVRFVYADLPEREDLIEKFKTKRMPVMIATEGIIGEGFDFRGLDAIIVADGGKSNIQTVQKVGRGMRVEDGKIDVMIFDFADRGKYVGEHAMRRKTIWDARGFKVDTSDTPYL